MAMLLCASNLYAQDTTASPQRYTKIITDGTISDSLLNLINSVAKTHYIYNDSIIVPRLSPSKPEQRLLGIEEDNSQPRSYPADSLTKHGYLQKSLANGNNKNLSQSTQTDLTISGPIGGGFTLEAAISESDMPVDDDGATRQISELSNASISIRKGKSVFSAGDIFLNQYGTEFINYNKKIKGFKLSTIAPIKKGKTDSVYISAATANLKGRYRRQQICGIENSQGPYYLTDPDGQSVIILSHTETVWIDGNRLTPGIGNDYVIDYNSGSITFEPKIQITAQTLITVDFEYSHSLYSRSFSDISAGLQHGIHKVTLNYITEYDRMPNDDTDSADIANNPPKKKSYLALLTRTGTDSTTLFTTETVLLKNIPDRMMPKGYYNDTYAGCYTFYHRFGADTARYTFINADYKFSSKGFVSIEENKNADFLRVWNIPYYTGGSQEQFADFKIERKALNGFSGGYSGMLADVADVFKGTGNVMNINYKNDFIKTGISSAFYGTDHYQNSITTRLTASAFAEFYKDIYTFGSAYKLKSGTHNNLSDSADFNYKETQFYTAAKTDNAWIKITAADRFTFASSDIFTSESNSRTRSIAAEYEVKKSDIIKLSGIEILKKIRQDYDTLSIRESMSLTGRTEALLQLFDHRFKISSTAETESGVMEKAGFTFLKTSAGNGYYVWNDYNQNGEQEINEFEKAFYKTDADYVKYYTHTGRYVSTISQRYAISTTWNGKKLYSNITLSSLLKSAADDGFVLFKGDSTIARSAMFKTNSKYQIFKPFWILGGFSNAQNKRLTFYGEENDRQRLANAGVESQIIEIIRIGHIYEQGFEDYNSEFFPEKNYRIDLKQNTSTVNIKIGKTSDISVVYENLLKHCSNSDLTTNSLTAKYLYASDAGNIAASLSYVRNDFKGDENPSVKYQMLAGLQNGNNLVANISAGIVAAKFLHISVDFDIRKSKDKKTILGGILTAKVVLD